MKLHLETRTVAEKDHDLERLIEISNGQAVYANVRDASFEVTLDANKRIYMYGEIFYHVNNDGMIKIIESDSKQYLEKIFCENSLVDVISRLEGQYLGICVDTTNNMILIFSDRYARLDSFYVQNGSNFIFSTDLDFIFENIKPEYDQKMLAHIFSVYGCYTPKGLTIYKNIKQLRVGEIITLSDSGIHSEMIEFKALEIEDYTDKELEVYYQILRESVVSRANRGGKTWVSSSSGWDSSILLGILIDEFGRKNVGMLTGSMKYSEKTDIINKFEVDKINKIGNYYGIKPERVEFDFKSKTASDYWGKVLPYYKSKHMYTFATYNFAKLSDRLSDLGGNGQTIFNGETSDSFHNFGFSQFSTFFHTNKTFTEYADKMNCYLYGPSFFKKVMDGSYEKDKVFQIFIKMIEGVGFASRWSDREKRVESYLFPFFYGSPRIPFAKTYINPALTELGQKSVYNFSFREYIPEALSSLSDTNIYSWLIYLYQCFHSQGATVNTHKHSMEYNKHKWRMPFNDLRLVRLLSKAPEKWGRGLEMNNTKYPLKWVARNKIRFPYDILEEGPHAYLWDVLEGVSLTAEVVYRSGVTGFFKDAVSSGSYKNILSDEYFDVLYLDKLVRNYLDGNEASGKDFNNLVSLITLCITGWY